MKILLILSVAIVSANCTDDAEQVYADGVFLKDKGYSYKGPCSIFLADFTEPRNCICLSSRLFCASSRQRRASRNPNCIPGDRWTTELCKPCRCGRTDTHRTYPRYRRALQIADIFQKKFAK